MRNDEAERGDTVRQAEPSLPSAHERYLDLAKKGFLEPDTLSKDEIWHLCRAMIFYAPRLSRMV